MASQHADELRSEDNDSIMTDDVDIDGVVVALGSGEGDLDVEDDEEDDEEGDVDAGAEADAEGEGPQSPLDGNYHSLSATPTAPIASTSTSTFVSTSTSSNHRVNLRPSAPLCEFGDRLGFTYFAKPLPTAAQLNHAHRHGSETYWLTVDNDLTYLSFFRDTGPVSTLRYKLIATVRAYTLVCYSSTLDASIASVCICMIS